MESERSEPQLAGSSLPRPEEQRATPEIDPVIAELQGRLEIARAHSLPSEAIQRLEQHITEEREKRLGLERVMGQMTDGLTDVLLSGGYHVIDLTEASPETISQAVADWAGSDRKLPVAIGVDTTKRYWLPSAKADRVQIMVDLDKKEVTLSLKK